MVKQPTTAWWSLKIDLSWSIRIKYHLLILDINKHECPCEHKCNVLTDLIIDLMYYLLILCSDIICIITLFKLFRTWLSPSFFFKPCVQLCVQMVLWTSSAFKMCYVNKAAFPCACVYQYLDIYFAQASSSSSERFVNSVCCNAWTNKNVNKKVAFSFSTRLNLFLVYKPDGSLSNTHQTGKVTHYN